MTKYEPPLLNIESAKIKSNSTIFGFFEKIPLYPPLIPRTLYPLAINVLAILPTTVFIPGAGPPPVKIIIVSFILYFIDAAKVAIIKKYLNL